MRNNINSEIGINKLQLNELDLEKEKENSVKNIIEILLSIGADQKYRMTDVEQAQHIFDILQRLQAICISEVSVSYNDVAQNCDNFSSSTKKLSLAIYDERIKIKNNSLEDMQK